MKSYKPKHGFMLCCFVLLCNCLSAQTEMDGVMMLKNNFCTGLMYNTSQWDQYWEGTFKRNNENLGTVSTKMYGWMGNYGVSNKLNLLFGIPYVETRASAGTLHGLKGVQDLSLWLKWNPLEMPLGKGLFSVYGVGGFSFPVSNYPADFLPLSIGLHSSNLSLRGIADYQIGSYFATVSATYVVRSNVAIDRSAYYTTEMHLTNKIDMPDVTNFQLRTGFRLKHAAVEMILNNSTTLGGFDITKNNMPFPSNRMNMTTAGINMKYNLPAVSGLSVIAGGSLTLGGRNVGQATSFNGGIFYVFDFSKKSTKN